MRSVAFSPDGRYVLSVTTADDFCPETGTELTLTDLTTGEEMWNAITGAYVTRGIAFINNGRQIAPMDGGCSNNVIVWDAATGEQVDEWEGHEIPGWGLTASREGTLVATAANDGTSIIWDATTGTTLYTLHHEARLRTVAFSPDASQLLTAADDGIIRLWDTESGALLQQLSGHTSGVLFVDFIPDGRYAATSGRDNNLFVWDLQVGEAVRSWQLQALTPLGHVVAFGPDSNSIFINDANNALVRINLMLQPSELIDWVQANRYVRDLNCTERALYRVEPLCTPGE